MFCPQCGTESSSGQQYCRLCGANLKVIGKALTLSEAIARSDRGPLPKLKEMVRSLKIDQVTEEVSRALERMNKEIIQSSSAEEGRPRKAWWQREKKTAAERREDHLTKGTVSMFSGVGLMIFLYYLSAALVLKLPPEVIAQIPFELDPVVRIMWLLGLIPALSGFGHIVAGLLIRPSHLPELPGKFSGDSGTNLYAPPTSPEFNAGSVTEHTTHWLKPPEQN